MTESDYPILGGEIAKARKFSLHHLLTSNPATMAKSGQITIPPYKP